jgi:hypothetical protein
VRVENEVFYEEGTSSDYARAEFREKLFARLTGMNGVREREEASTLAYEASTQAFEASSPASESNASTSEGLPAAQTAMIAVVFLTAASIALVVVQRKFAKNKNADDKSVVSVETMPNTIYDTTPMTGHHV